MRIGRILKIVSIVLGVIFVVILSYVAYVFLTYHRIDDNQILESYTKGEVKKQEVSLNTEYSILTYNIGFGAYSSDYSFFMDGGKFSRAYNKQAAIDNINGSIKVVKSKDTDFVFIQEVDLKATRSYGVNENEMILDAFQDISSAFAVNYDSPYLMYPILEPHGKSKAGISTISKFRIIDSVRRSLPIDTSVYKLIDLDRCYTISRIKVENGKYLCLYNVHLSAYTKDESIVKNQIKMLSEDMKSDFEEGNYIICGGDFNQDLLGDSPSIFHTPTLEENWAKPFPSLLLPSGITVAYDLLSDELRGKLTPSCRNADSPYIKETSFVTMVDGFLISTNVQLNSIETIDNGFLYSDHNPVIMKFQLMPVK
ncbi:endonuclease/exonuclease/phosphatase family protein [Lachnoclostridium phytofermentans]|uniref:Endonuclease/exonuclease/phosphatase n=1 Tax=Lachnoclostridium phytofermentans (strain ATCC 700394 / DSM 18823 / ISDg) TaxID=357809 RepID=A9KQJ5_LACP7|nr:endonuclease/exonuclease/phosphatase family protein [Lachnoclostridium phytofermentans]ABX41908.1 Endonuclease/exonuclease/phosphatase [Lachnoclostridium phytofermentans ISDg]